MGTFCLFAFLAGVVEKRSLPWKRNPVALSQNKPKPQQKVVKVPNRVSVLSSVPSRLQLVRGGRGQMLEERALARDWIFPSHGMGPWSLDLLFFAFYFLSSLGWGGKFGLDALTLYFPHFLARVA